MEIANVYEAKTHLSRLLRRVRAGEEIIIAEAGRPIARLVPIEPPRGPRVLGGDEELVRIADDFDAPLPEDVVDTFYAGAGVEQGRPVDGGAPSKKVSRKRSPSKRKAR